MPVTAWTRSMGDQAQLRGGVWYYLPFTSCPRGGRGLSLAAGVGLPQDCHEGSFYIVLYLPLSGTWRRWRATGCNSPCCSSLLESWQMDGAFLTAYKQITSMTHNIFIFHTSASHWCDSECKYLLNNILLTEATMSANTISRRQFYGEHSWVLSLFLLSSPAAEMTYDACWTSK